MREWKASQSIRRAVCFVMLSGTLASLALAQQQGAARPGAREVQTLSTEAAVSGTDFPVLRTIGGLALVLSLILIAFLGARKIAPQYFNNRPSAKSLKVIESMPMGDKRSIALIRVGEKCYLVGNTPGQITLLSALDDALWPAAEPERATSPPQESKRFPDPFRKLYEDEQLRTVPKPVRDKSIPPDVRAKMRQLREALEG